jgi:EAL domain-containing protein (putative c-di-GMP-specific phosphodiesterase class I)
MHWLDLGALSNENEKLRELLYDEITRLPTVSLLLSEIQDLLKTHAQIGLLYIDIVNENEIERTFGHVVFDQVMGNVAKILQQLKGISFREDDRISAVMKNGNAFVLLLAPSRENRMLLWEDLTQVRKRVEEDLNDSFQSALPFFHKKFRSQIGCALLGAAPNIRTERLVFNALEAAREDVSRRELAQRNKQIERLRLLIRKENIKVLFQPIVDLSSQRAIGFEALSRGPSDMESPEKLFQLALESNMVWQLDRVCRQKAFLAAKALEPEQLLFLNINPHTVGDPELRKITESPLLLYSELKPERIVFEISERSMVSDVDLFKLVLEYFRALGFKIAVDDAGSGFYSGLEIIAKIKPDFVKIDRPLIRQIDQDPVRQQLVATIVNFASQVEARSIGEGVETAAEAETLKDIGISFGQGYYFSPPKVLAGPAEDHS